MICVFKCPCCGDKMGFSIEKQAMECPTCGTVCEMEEYDMNNMSYEGYSLMEDDFRTLSCPACGARIAMNEGEAMHKCGYCESELAAFGVAEDIFCPEKIIPFSVTEEIAKRKLINWWIEHPSMPKLNFDKMKMTFSDMYVPVWLIDAGVVTDVTARTVADKMYESDVSMVGGRPRYSRMSLMDDFDKDESRRIVTKTQYRAVPFDASCHIRDEQFFNIEPFDYGKMQDFNAGYLSGHMAEVYYFSPQETIPRMISRIKEFSIEECISDIEIGNSIQTVDNIEKKECDVTPSRITYVLLPVWVCKYEFDGKKQYIYINGQTGKVDADVLFKNVKYKNSLVKYGISAAVFSLAIVLSVFSLTVMPNFNRELTKMVFYMDAIALMVIFGNEYVGRNKKSSEEIQMRQGKKMFVSTDTLINYILAFMVLLISAIPIAHIFSSGHWWVPFPVILVTALVAAFMCWRYKNKLDSFYSFKNKTRYFDYVNSFNKEVLYKNWK